MKAANLKAIDVHVHIEHTGAASGADTAAEKYFGASGAPRERNALADYYRSRNMACVVFTVDERLTGRPMVPHDNSDVAIPFASIDPTRGPEAVREAKRLVAGGARGLKLHPPLQQFSPN